MAVNKKRTKFLLQAAIRSDDTTAYSAMEVLPFIFKAPTLNHTIRQALMANVSVLDFEIIEKFESYTENHGVQVANEYGMKKLVQALTTESTKDVVMYVLEHLYDALDADTEEKINEAEKAKKKAQKENTWKKLNEAIYFLGLIYICLILCNLLWCYIYLFDIIQFIVVYLL